MQIKRLELSESEAAVMRCVWNFESVGITGKQIKSLLMHDYDLNYAPNTIYTILDKLKDKGFIRRVKAGKVLEFFPTIPYETYRNDVMQKACDDWFNGDWSAMADWLSDKVV